MPYKRVIYIQDMTYPQNRWHRKKIGKSLPCPQAKSIDDIIFDSLKERLLSFEDSFVSLTLDNTKNRMWDR